MSTKKGQRLRYVAVIVTPDKIVDAFKAGEELAKIGTIQLAFLPGQESIAREWECAARLGESRSTLVELLCKQSLEGLPV